MEFYNEDDTFLVSVPLPAEIELKLRITKYVSDEKQLNGHDFPRTNSNYFMVVIPVSAV